MNSEKPEQFLSVKEFAHAVGWGDDTIRRLVYRKIIRAVILPQFNPKRCRHRRVRIPRSEVQRFIERNSNVA